MHEVEVDRQAVERRQARLAVGADRLRATVRPTPADRAIPPFVTIRAIASAPPRGSARARSRSLWPSSRSSRPYERAVSKTVTPALDRRRDRPQRELLVAALVRRQPHAAEPDAELRGGQPVKDGSGLGTYVTVPARVTEVRPCPLPPTRETVHLSRFPDLVVIYLGIRVEGPRGFETLGALSPQIEAAVAAGPDGLLLHENITYSEEPVHVGMRQYWRDFQSLEAWANTSPTSRGGRPISATAAAPSFWHETYFRRGASRGRPTSTSSSRWG